MKNNPWSVRITRDYRAVALRSGEEWVWLWIGDHQEFDRRFPGEKWRHATPARTAEFTSITASSPLDTAIRDQLK